MAGIDQVVLWGEMLMLARTDLRQWLYSRRSPERRLFPSLAAYESVPKFQFSFFEGPQLARVQRRALVIPNPRFPTRVCLSSGPVGWVTPRALPRSVSQAQTTVMFWF